MPTQIDLDDGDKDLLAKVIRFAERRACNGVYMNLLHDNTTSLPVILLFGIGEQALALEKIVMGARAPEDTSNIVDKDGNPF